MEPNENRRLMGRVLGLLGAIVIAAGVWLATHSSRTPPAPKADTPTGEETPAMRERRLGEIDPSKKTEWVDDVPGVELAALPAAKREIFLRFANAEACSCGCGFTLAACRRFDSTCEVSGPRTQLLYDSVAAGLITRADGLRTRPAAH